MKKQILTIILCTSLLTTTFLQGKRYKQQESAEESNAPYLPKEISALICGNLFSLKDRKRFEQTCRQFREVGQESPVYLLRITNSHLQPQKFGSLLRFLANHKIHTLNFSSTQITNDQLAAILNQIGESLRVLNLYISNFGSYKNLNDFAPIARCKNLERLDLSYNITDAQLTEILVQIGERLRVLRLWDCRNLRDFSSIANCPNLQVLDLYRTKITNEQLARILGEIGEPLRELNLNSCRRLTDFSSIANCSRLQVLVLGSHNITDAQLAALLGEIGEPLRELNLNSCRRLTDFSCIANCINLQTLNLHDTKITDEQLLEILGHLRGNLRSINLQFCQQLQNHKEIKRICRKKSGLHGISYSLK